MPISECKSPLATAVTIPCALTVHVPYVVVIPIPKARCRVLIEVRISGIKTRIEVVIPERVTAIARTITPVVVGSVGWPSYRYHDHPIMMVVMANGGAQMMGSRLVRHNRGRMPAVATISSVSF